MNIWLTAALALLPALAAAGVLAAAGDIPNRFVAIEFASTIAVFMLMLLSAGYDQPSFIDLAITLTLLSFPAALAYAHFLERWL